jgi:AP-1 complex subunit mu
LDTLRPQKARSCKSEQTPTDLTGQKTLMFRYITQESHKLETQARPPMAVTNAVSWRSEGIRYRKNEVFLDVVESVNLLVSSDAQITNARADNQVNAAGNVIRSEILGAVKMKCYLSGMPELRLGLNDKVMFESTGRGTLLVPRCLAGGS